MGKASGVSSFFCDVLYLLCRRTFLSFRFRTFLSSHSKQGLTPKIVTLICLVIELKVFLQEIIGKDACAILIVTIESLSKFLCWNHHCTLSSYLVSIQFPFHNAVLKILLILFLFFVFSCNFLHFLSSVPCNCLSSSVCPFEYILTSTLLYESARPALGFYTFPRTPAPPISVVQKTLRITEVYIIIWY